MRHSMINYPNSSSRKCTRCGAMHYICKWGATYRNMWVLNGVEYAYAPDCKVFNEEETNLINNTYENTQRR